MKADNIELHRYLGVKDRIFVIPLYQRYYDWTSTQCERLFLDIEHVIKHGNRHFTTILSTSFHFVKVFVNCLGLRMM